MAIRARHNSALPMVAAALAKALVALWRGPSTVAAPAVARAAGSALGVPAGLLALVGARAVGGKRWSEIPLLWNRAGRHSPRGDAYASSVVLPFLGGARERAMRMLATAAAIAALLVVGV